MSRKMAAGIVLAISSVAAFAYGAQVVSRNLASNLTISSAFSMEVYDPSCSGTALSILNYPNMGAPAGSTSSITVCLKSTGNTAFWIVRSGEANSVTFQGLAGTGLSGDWSTTSVLPIELTPISTAVITITITNDGTASAGSKTFITVIQGFSTSLG